MGVGCSECTTGFVAVEVNNKIPNPFICTSSTYLVNLQKTSTKFIDKCKHYSVFNEKLIC